MHGVRSGATVSTKFTKSHSLLSTTLISNRFFFLCNFFSMQSAITTSRRNYGGGNFRAPKMNDLPVPEGDFFHHHAKRQRKHNAVLGLGVAMFGSALFMVRQKNSNGNFQMTKSFLFLQFKQSKINLNYSPPDTYE